MEIHHLWDPLSPSLIMIDLNNYIFLESQRDHLWIPIIKINIWKKKITTFWISNPPRPPLDIIFFIFQNFKIKLILYLSHFKNKIHGFLIVKSWKKLTNIREKLLFEPICLKLLFWMENALKYKTKIYRQFIKITMCLMNHPILPKNRQNTL